MGRVQLRARDRCPVSARLVRCALSGLICAAFSAVAPTHAQSSAVHMRAMVALDGALEFASVPMPVPQAGQVRVRVSAASVNPVDWKLAAAAPHGTPMIPGRDFCGRIDALGPGVQGWRVGQAVIGVSASGAYAPYTLAASGAIARAPRSMSCIEAAGLPVAGESAWRSVVVVAEVRPGQRVLIHGGAGGVGTSTVQVAKARGAYVIATASASHFALLRELGADQTLDYHRPDFDAGLANLDAVINAAEEATGERSLRLLRPGGILVSLVGLPDPAHCRDAHVRCEAIGRVSGKYLEPLVALVDAGRLRVPVERVLPLDQAAAAWEESRAHHVRGKVILRVQ